MAQATRAIRVQSLARELPQALGKAKKKKKRNKQKDSCSLYYKGKRPSLLDLFRLFRKTCLLPWIFSRVTGEARLESFFSALSFKISFRQPRAHWFLETWRKNPTSGGEVGLGAQVWGRDFLQQRCSPSPSPRAPDGRWFSGLRVCPCVLCPQLLGRRREASISMATLCPELLSQQR